MTQINKASFQKLIDFDIKWIMDNSPPALPKAHIVQVLKASPDKFYPPPNQEVSIDKKPCFFCNKNKDSFRGFLFCGHCGQAFN